MRIALLLGSMLVLGCGGLATSGACEQSATTGTRFCHNFRDTQVEKGTDICTRLRGTWTGGATCARHREEDACISSCTGCSAH